MGFLQGKRILITGVLSNRSIAYGIAQACHREGAELAFTYVGERFKDRITEFANEFGSNLVFECDVGDDAQIDAVFTQLRAHWPKLDGLVHTIGFAPRGYWCSWVRTSAPVSVQPKNWHTCARMARVSARPRAISSWV